MNPSLTISEIQIFPVKPKDGLVAFASCVINGALSINSIAIHTRLGGGYRLVYPSKTLPNGKQIGSAYPISREVGSQLEDAIISKFLSVTNQ